MHVLQITKLNHKNIFSLNTFFYLFSPLFLVFQITKCDVLK